MRPGPNPPVLKDTATESNETLGKLMLFRQEYVTRPTSSMHVLPHAVCGLGRTDSVGEPDDDRLSRNSSRSRRQTDAAATHVCTVLPCAAIQRRTGAILWWEFLGVHGQNSFQL